jgi:ferredoxin-NADP reductase
LSSGAVFARAMQLMADATRLIDAARRTRDHTVTPATPAEVAEAMQRELHELMAAESTYHSETNKYSSDVVAAGYHPVPAVRVTTIDVNDRAWAARATTPILPGKSCVVYLGQPKKTPKTSADHAHPDSAREVACDKP